MPRVADWVKDTTSTTGTGNLTLSGTAAAGYVTFFAAFGLHVRFPYVIWTDGSTEREAGIGYLSAATTLVREHVNKSSNANNKVNLSAGSHDVFVDLSADWANRQTSRGVSMALASGRFFGGR